jgi:hypothetical protein
MSEPRGADASAPPDEVRAQIERILRSRTLSGSDQLRRLLRLVVERTLSGQPELLKEYSLGLEVFQRPPDYDPKVDPIVRVQAGRLRSKLVEYYASEGAHDSVIIQIPKGAYVPVFNARNAAAPTLDINRGGSACGWRQQGSRCWWSFWWSRGWQGTTLPFRQRTYIAVSRCFRYRCSVRVEAAAT